jgi:integrase
MSPNTFKFTVPKLTSLPIPPKPPMDKKHLGLVEYFDVHERGLMLRVSYSGTKTFAVVAKNKEGKRKKKTLGKFMIGGSDGMDLADARIATRAFKGEYAAGRDVVAEIRGEKEEQDSAPTVNYIIDRYLAEHVSSLAAKTQYQATNILVGSAKRQETKSGPPTVRDEFGDMKFRDVRRKQVVEYLNGIRNRGTGYAANRAHEVINHMFKFAILESIDETVEHSVANLWKRTSEKPRDRWLTDKEITRLFKILDDVLVPNNALIYRLLLATGQRQSEVLTMKWEHLDFEKGDWTIPAEETKSNRIQLVPMFTYFRQLLLGRERTSEYVFPSPGYRTRYSQSGHLTRNSFANVHPQVVAEAGVEHFRYHDLRRSMSTHMGELGIDEFIVSRVLNHAPKGVTGRHYNHYSYRDEKHRALEAWGYKLMWLSGQTPSQELISKLHEWGFGKSWVEKPWNLEQWNGSADNVVPLVPGASA